MRQYHDTLRTVLDSGHETRDRTGVGTVSFFHPAPMIFNLKNGFPLVTTKKVFFKGVVAELLWMLSGSTNSIDLEEQGVNIWKEWSDPDGNLGPVYGHQFRNWNGIDQISQLIQNIKDDPYSRRHIVSAWNVSDLPDMALAPCHCFFQVHVREETNQLSLALYQRSADMFLGVPFNIASYALLTHMIAAQTGYTPHEFIHVLGDAHVYSNHMDQVYTQLDRQPFPLPSLVLNPKVKSIFDYQLEDIQIKDYVSHPPIKGKVAV